MKVLINNKEYEFLEKTSLEEMAKTIGGKYYCARVNNRIRELSYRLETENAEVSFLDASDYDSVRIYEASLRYIVAMAVSRLWPKKNIRFSNSISMAIYAKIVGEEITENQIKELSKEVRKIIKGAYPIRRKSFTIEEMKEYYSSLGYTDKIETLKYRKEKVNVYEADGYRNYMYSYMVPDTSYIHSFKFTPMYPGFIIQYPRSEENGRIPKFKDEPRFLKTLASANSWSANTQSENIYQINDKFDDKDELIKFLGVCETIISHQLKEIGDKVYENIDTIRLIAIAGPSSSGKTTFSKRLEIELMSRNIHPIRISLDNYYLTNDKVPRDENGQLDFEDIRALKIKEFNKNMEDFIQGKRVRIPIFDFHTKTTSYSEPMTLQKDGVIIIEGIHALNDLMTASIAKERVFKIYIAPLSQRNIDNHNPISLTDQRLVRRIVRDMQFRNTPPEETLSMWKSVRRGEHKWIYPTMENADYIFNSELGYELPVLKKYAVSSLKGVENDSPYYILANKLLKFLKVFRSISDDAVPNYSIIREFIGGSIFEE